VHDVDYGQFPDVTKINFKNDVIFTWNGTTSGVKVPNADWIPDNRDGLTICDATSAIFAMPIDYRKCDVLTWSWQKVLGGEAAHGMIAMSPRALNRLESFQPSWPVPKIFRIANNKKVIKGIFEGSTINTPSMICVEDALDGLNWAEKNGGLNFLLDTSINSFNLIYNWVQQNDWVTFLSENKSKEYLSNTGITGESIIMGILLLKELQSRKKKTKLSVVSINTDSILENIEKFTDLCKIICKLTQTIYELKEKVCNNLQELHNESYKCEVEIKNVLKSIQYEIVNEFNKINSEITLIEKDELSILLDEIKLNENKLYPSMLIVVDIIETYKLKFCNIQNKWGILNMNDELICDIKKYKTKLEMKFMHKLTHKIQLDISLLNKDLIISEILKTI